MNTGVTDVTNHYQLIPRGQYELYSTKGPGRLQEDRCWQEPLGKPQKSKAMIADGASQLRQGEHNPIK